MNIKAIANRLQKTADKFFSLPAPTQILFTLLAWVVATVCAVIVPALGVILVLSSIVFFGLLIIRLFQTRSQDNENDSL